MAASSRRHIEPLLSHPLIVDAGLATETDAGLALGTLIVCGLASESDDALAAAPNHRVILGLATETEVTFALGTIILCGQADETDSALALVSAFQQITVGLASETDTARPLLVGIVVNCGLASETTSALALQSVTVNCGLAAETDSALVLQQITVNCGVATESELGLPLRQLTIICNLAVESDSARAMPKIIVECSEVVETDSVPRMRVPLEIRCGQATVVDSAFGLRKITVNCGLATERNFGLPLRRMIVNCGQASEIDAALSLVSLGVPSESAMALPLRVPITVSCGLGAELNVAFTVTPIVTALARIPVTPITRTGVAPPSAVVSRTGGMFVSDNDGRIFLEIVSTDLSTQTVRIPLAATIDGQHAEDRIVTVPAGSTRRAGPFPEEIYNQDDESLLVNPSVDATLELRAYSPPRDVVILDG